ncbi:pilus assembly protein CpaB [Actinoplanes lutulentus]|uniref:Pilus assembly protein CpaB n=1 Tax=Actinoplanes lutulentus TaxID=1287878 RepID=A0A327ZBB9_9ACTN|nr:RcpC/CpaB family pilus assembly protein [Actinoplanes lutulentus]MBB2941251.1 pilus assembly protein CpaB [Actinoplanes lutulentus]RAK36743.1 pilus assembly protein CpaB [Actinoplanes lutulentus]
MRRRILILLAALLLAGISGTAVLSYARSADRRALSGNQGLWVLVAKQRIPADTLGSAIREQGLTERILVPAKTVPDGALTVWDPDLDKLRLTAPLERSQLLMRPLFQTQVKVSPTPSRRIKVPKGRLAVSVALNVAPQVGGDVEPGDKVAVYASCMFDIIGGELDGKQDRRTRLLLPDAKVITIGEAPAPTTPAPTTPTPTATTSVTASPSPSASGKYDTAPSTTSLQRYVATLSVDATDAQRLIHATQQCWLYLALLGPKATPTVGEWVNSQELFE